MKRNFTLIELLVVIGIIAILAGLIFPVLSNAREKSKSLKCKNNLHGIGVAIQMYLNDSADLMPNVASMPSLGLNSLPRIVDTLAPHLPSNKLMKCPADSEKDYFKNEGSSYQFNTMLCSRRVKDTFLSKRFGDSKVFVMFDYEPFHGKAGSKGAANYLFADGHVGDIE